MFSLSSLIRVESPDGYLDVCHTSVLHLPVARLRAFASHPGALSLWDAPFSNMSVWSSRDIATCYCPPPHGITGHLSLSCPEQTLLGSSRVGKAWEGAPLSPTTGSLPMEETIRIFGINTDENLLTPTCLCRWGLDHHQVNGAIGSPAACRHNFFYCVCCSSQCMK